MMNLDTIQIIDVTLRDGGYKTNFYFSEEVVERTLNLLDNSGIDYIEVGYRNGSFKPIPNIGPAGICNLDYLEYCRKRIKNAKLTTIFHPKNIIEDDIAELKKCGVDCVRICFSIQNQSLCYKTIELIKKYELEFFVNITRSTQYNFEELANIIRRINQFNPQGIYLADSNGSFTPDDVSLLFSYLLRKRQFSLGFHAHDNLFVAQANAIAAIQSGVKYVDSSLFGLGKGAGNLRTEGLVSFLLSKGVSKYNLGNLLEAAELIKLKIQYAERELTPKDIIMGIFNLSQDDAVHLGAFSSAADYLNRAEEYL